MTQKNDTPELRKELQLIEETWEVPKIKLPDGKVFGNTKKVYTYMKDHVDLHVLTEQVDGCKFAVFDGPIGVFYGFSNFVEAETFAKQRRENIKAKIRLLGGW